MNLLLAALILTAFVSDAKRSLIPNILTMTAAAGGLVYHLAFEGWDGLLSSVFGFSAGFVMLLILYLFGALGAGDVKLFAAIGAIMGTVFVWQSMMYSLVYAGLIGVVLLIIRKKLVTTGKKMACWLFAILTLKDFSKLKIMKEQELLQFPFMYAVLPGVVTTWYYSQF